MENPSDYLGLETSENESISFFFHTDITNSHFKNNKGEEKYSYMPESIALKCCDTVCNSRDDHIPKCIH